MLNWLGAHLWTSTLLRLKRSPQQGPGLETEVLNNGLFSDEKSESTESIRINKFGCHLYPSWVQLSCAWHSDFTYKCVRFSQRALAGRCGGRCRARGVIGGRGAAPQGHSASGASTWKTIFDEVEAFIFHTVGLSRRGWDEVETFGWLRNGLRQGWDTVETWLRHGWSSVETFGWLRNWLRRVLGGREMVETWLRTFSSTPPCRKPHPVTHNLVSTNVSITCSSQPRLHPASGKLLTLMVVPTSARRVACCVFRVRLGLVCAPSILSRAGLGTPSAALSIFLQALVFQILTFPRWGILPSSSRLLRRASFA